MSQPAIDAAPVDPEPDDLESLPAPSSVQRSPALVRNRVIEEITESPADKPGSGQRRSIRPETALPSSSRLQSALRSDDSVPANSSPTTYKSRRSDATNTVRSVRSVRQTPSRSPQDDVDELSPDGPPELPSIAEITPTRATVPPGGPTSAPQSAGNDEPGTGDKAVEVGDAEAAKVLRRRPGPRPRVSSPELGSNDRNEQVEGPTPEAEQPRRKRGRPSPAKQKQGAPKTKAKPAKAAPKPKTAKTQSKAKTKPKTSPKRKRRGSDEEKGDAAIELTIQRFVNHKKRDDEGADPLQLEIPFANRTGESALDVFAQVCDEVIDNTVAQFEGMLEAANDTGKKKELRVKIRAVEAYREVLSSRLLEHVSVAVITGEDF